MVRTFIIAVPGLTLPFVIRAAVIQGVATATEVSTVGVVYTALLGLLVYRQFDWRRIYPILVDTVSLTGAVMLIIGTATAMAWALTQSGFLEGRGLLKEHIMNLYGGIVCPGARRCRRWLKILLPLPFYGLFRCY